ncbi:MAG: 50S ribosomal protein L6 [Candidatus Berkelbacteria bacterium]|nr:50S ribosomal protein L6 [Candidatus Berkelbacteria bacterium]
MSRIGKRKIIIPENVSVEIAPTSISISGPRGEKTFQLSGGINVKTIDGALEVNRLDDSKNLRSLHGTTKRVIENIIAGVSAGFTKKLDFKGVGYTVISSDGNLTMRLGYSHPVVVPIPDNLTATVIKNSIVVEGNSKEDVGAFCAKVREFRKPEVYKGKGIKYHDEFIKKKAGKTAQAVGK